MSASTSTTICMRVALGYCWHAAPFERAVGGRLRRREKPTNRGPWALNFACFGAFFPPVSHAVGILRASRFRYDDSGGLDSSTPALNQGGWNAAIDFVARRVL